MKNIVITIGREYGSGGRYIGEQVAKKLNIPFYDQKLITKTYEKNNINYSKLKNSDEVKSNSILKRFEMLDINNYYSRNDLFMDNVYQNLIEDTIKEVSNQSCVILGRNSNQILKNHPNAIHLFIYSKDLEFKIKRKMEIEKLSRNEATKRLKYIDKQRKEYYESLNKNSIWGAKQDYDFCIDSGKLGISDTIDLIIDIYKKYQKKV